MSTTTGSNGHSRSGEIIAVQVSMLSLATVIMVLRQMSRVLVQHLDMRADDWFISVAWVFSVASTVGIYEQTRFGLGTHIAALPSTTNFAFSLELYYFGEIGYFIIVSTTKVSILYLYLQLSPFRTFRIMVWSLMAFIAATAFTSVVAVIFQCTPIYKTWYTSVEGTCIDQVAVFISNAALNILQDFMVYFLPVPMLWKLQLPRKQRFALIIIFVAGGFVVITGIIRLASLRDAAGTQDHTWDSSSAVIWSAIEGNVGIVCACLIHFKPVLARYAPRLLGIQRSTVSGIRIPSGDGRAVVTIGTSDRPIRNKGTLTDQELELEENTFQIDIIRS